MKVTPPAHFFGIITAEKADGTHDSTALTLVEAGEKRVDTRNKVDEYLEAFQEGEYKNIIISRGHVLSLTNKKEETVEIRFIRENRNENVTEFFELLENNSPRINWILAMEVIRWFIWEEPLKSRLDWRKTGLAKLQSKK